ncbi:tetratricopeptide repeat protein [Actinocrispum wychmicini]|uniref:tetratricopeptide repeat protein n=1 Tax=Actinocrispum wychmicini TaxID=1213861 RepID=UPI00104BB031|nr:tetratricopeptide repeat protein [Actinocrispum wychmicini]
MSWEYDDLERPDEDGQGGHGGVTYNVEVGGATDGPVVAGSHNIVVDARHGSSVTVGRVELERRYWLGPVEPEPHAQVGELSVSQLLAARNGVVEFTRRGAELDELRRWCEMSTVNCAALLVYGPGGQGKTRLATQFAVEARRTGWYVVAARHVGDSTRARGYRSGGGAGGSEVHASTGAAGLLVLVDYAERWPIEDLLSMADDFVMTGDMPVRLLLMARSTGWWTSVRHEFTERRFRAAQLRLGPLAAKVIDRNSLFDEARDRFAAVLGVFDVHRIPHPVNLAEDAFGLVLAVHMAALAAVDAHARGQQAPTDPVALSAYLLDREFAYWQRLCSAGRVRIRPSTMARTVFTATLTRPLPYRHAVSVLEGLGVPSASEPADIVLADHGCCYPPADPDTLLEPLYPDRLAEDFLALMLPGHDVAGYQPDAWTSAVPTHLLGGATGDPAAPPSPGVIRAALTMLVEAARRWPHLVRRQLAPLLRTRPELALAAGSAVLSALAELSELDMGVLAAIESQFPVRGLAHLDPGIADITARLVEHQLSTERDPAVRATRLAHLADRLDAAGRHDEALAAFNEAVRIRRELAELLPLFFCPGLARSLLSLASQLTQLGRHEGAVAAVEESLGIYQLMAEREPDAYRGNVAVALERRGNCLSRLGRHAEALTAAQDAVRIRRELDAADPAAEPADLGRALENLAVQLAMVNRFEDASAAGEEALSIFRTLAATNPQEFHAELALSLNNLSGSWYRLGRLDQARDAAQEAVTLYRDLVAANPSAFRFPLTRALHNLGSVLSDLGDRAQGLALNEEAVCIRRELAAANPVASTADLARSLDGLAADLIDLGRHDQAVSIATEAVDILRPLAEQNPIALRRDFVRAQTRLSQALAGSGQGEPALAAARSAATEYHTLAAADPTMFWSDLADALNRLGNRLSTLHRWTDTLPYRKKAVRIGRVLARDGTTESRDRLAGLLKNLATSLITVKYSVEALAAMRESLRLYRELAEENSGRFRAELAWALSNIGVYLHGFQRWQEAHDATAEAVVLYRALAETDPVTYTPHLARSLNNLGVWLIALGRQHDARTSMAEAVRLREQLAAHDPDAFDDQLAESLDLLSFARNHRS